MTAAKVLTDAARCVRLLRMNADRADAREIDGATFSRKNRSIWDEVDRFGHDFHMTVLALLRGDDEDAARWAKGGAR